VNWLPEKNSTFTEVQWPWIVTLLSWQLGISLIVGLIIELLPFEVGSGLGIIGTMVGAQQMGMLLERRCPAMTTKQHRKKFAIRSTFILTTLSLVLLLIANYFFLLLTLRLLRD